MELLYVWIEDFKNIKRQGFNLSPKHWFEFTPTETDDKVTGGTLTHESRNPNYPNHFFGKNISNITAIVGKNGSGKSNLMEFLCYEYFHETAVVKVYWDTTEIILELNSIDKENITVNSDYYNDHVSNETYFYAIEMQPFIYTSVLEFRRYKSQSVIDISKYKTVKDAISVKEEGTVNPFINLQYKNTLEQVKFLSENKNEFKKAFPEYFYMPNALVFTLDYNVYNRQIYQSIRAFLEKDNLKPLQKTIIDAKCIILKNYISEWIVVNKGQSKESIVNEIINKSKGTKNPWKSFLNKIDQAASDPSSSSTNKKISKTIKLLEELLQDSDGVKISANPIAEDLVPDKKITKKYSSEFSSPRSFRYELEGKEGEDFFPLKNFLDKMLEINSDYHFFDFSWEGLSYGEDQLLSMFARLYDSEMGEQDEKRDIVLLIDEGELGLHPDWQRRYIDVLKHFINHFGKKWHKNIQLILTSHSPFLLSDLPKSNVIFLDKNEKGHCIVRNPEDISQTFGANIHSLYRSSFFLENGFVGEFAKQKIDWVIKLLNENDRKKVEENKQEVNFIIENIGEPLLRNKLREMYNGGKTVEDRIQALEEEIKQLKSLKGDKNDSD